MVVDAGSTYALRTDVAVESLGDDALVFQATDGTLLEVNPVAYSILTRLDGNSTLNDVAADMALAYGEPHERVIPDVVDTIAFMEKNRIVKRRVVRRLRKGVPCMRDGARYLCDPDVSCRIEDDDGAILFCAESVSTQVINPIGLEIWETLATPHTVDELVAHLLSVCDDVPEEDVRSDVDHFLNQLLKRGFIGEVETDADS